MDSGKTISLTLQENTHMLHGIAIAAAVSHTVTILRLEP